MSEALWELAPPVFLGVLLAILAVIFLMNGQAALLQGPMRLANALFGAQQCGHAGSKRGKCACGGAKGACACGRGRYGAK